MSRETAAASRPVSMRVWLGAITFGIALLAAWGLPQLDYAVNPGASHPGLISYLGVGLVVLALTMLLLFAGLRRLLPRTGVFLAAAFGYNAVLIAVKFGLGPAGVYQAETRYSSGFVMLSEPLAFPGLAAIAAILYGLAFFVIYLIFRAGLQRRLGIPIALEQRFLGLLLGMFVVAVVGGLTVFGLLGFLEYSLAIFFSSVVGVLIAVALVAAIALCSVAFKEASEQAALLRNITLLSTFAWVGLAFIAAYHIVWLVFLLTLISLWPLKAWTGK
jgi:hypothetical protein